MKYVLYQIFIALSLFGKDFGKWGNTFPIEEENLLDSIKSKAALHKAKLKTHAEEIEKYVQNPPAIAGIGKAMEYRSWEFDPTFIVEEDLWVEGILVAKSGTKINPLETTELPGGMLFFDGSDPDQLIWARNEPPDFQWVLVKGSPLALEHQEQRAVYYDQFGIFTSRFKIENVPAKVFQKRTLLQIEEIPVGGKK